MNSSTNVFGSMQVDGHPAMFALTMEPESSSSSYRLVIAQASGTFQVLLSSPQDLPREGGVEFLQRQLLAPDPAYTIRYESLSSSSSSSLPDRIRMQILQQLSLGIVRQVWDTTLLRTGTWYEFTEHLLHVQQQGQMACETLQTALRHVEHDREAWKETAHQLENVWQNEKSELLDNFLLLYHQQKEKTTQAQERIQQLEKLLQEKEQELTNVKKKSKKSHTFDNNSRILLQNEPDDMDSELYPQELVDQLAGGKNVKKKRPSATKTLNPKKRRNQATGAMEYYDEDEAVTDLLQTEKNSDAGKENSSKSKRKDDLQKARKKKVKDDSSTDSAGNYSYSSELDSDILAQLAAMKKRGD
ncbi:hypothetical protein FisN_11Lh231 [Fistulifera solaris]|uniref:Uncharacterized protein n=1 Tax=Fistulifera solaris TaxID=1519565 RepID=A0A1Z5J726_FISSO|nr:hypothetical protein FisN_11Lh231 [Fistulifera solaris]|eukprot:GAX09795.1 hypothetical protein FisN_11Lh231 [Fistulifera solaris]